MQVKDFTIQQLKENPSFRRMVRGIASAEEVEYWNQWIESKNENREKAKIALSEIVGFEFQSPASPNIESEWIKLNAKTNNRLTRFQKSNENTLKWIVRAVAVFLIVGFASVGTFYFSDSTQSLTHLEELIEERTIKTSDNEQKTLRFSNGAKVVLNRNSTLTYSLQKSGTNTINVTLEGEAWFDVESSASLKKPAFEVSTPDGIIRDIGTEFLVTVQDQQSRVILQEGIVEVHSAKKLANQDLKGGEKFRIKKGEMVEFTNSEIIQRKNVNPTFYTSWATGFMQLEKTSLEDLEYYIEQQFDVDVIVRDSNSELRDISLDGTVYFRSLDELIRSISEVIEIPISRSVDRNTIYIDVTE